MNNYKEIYNEEIDRLAEGIRDWLENFNDIGYDVKYEALKIVKDNFEEALRLTGISLHNQTFKQFCDELFEFEYCYECGGGTKDHEPNILLGNWFVRCKDQEN